MSYDQRKTTAAEIKQDLNKYKELLNQYNKELKIYLDSRRKDISIVSKLRVQLYENFSKLTREQLILNRLGPIIPIPSEIKTPLLQKKASQNKKIEILINKKGDYLIDGEYSSLEKFTEKIEGFTPEEIKKLDINIKASSNAPIGKVEALRTVLHNNNILKVNFTIHQETTNNVSTSQKTLQKELDPEGDIPFALLGEFPVYPGCTGDNKEIKACFNKSIQMHVSRKFNADLAKDLGLSSGLKKIYAIIKITKTGKIEFIKSRSPHEALNEEMKRVVSLYPKVTPGKYNGEVVDATYMIPVTFNVDNKNNKISNKIIPFETIQQVPIYPGCTGSEQELKKCGSKEIHRKIGIEFNAELASTLGLSSGDKKMMAKFIIDEKGNISNIEFPFYVKFKNNKEGNPTIIENYEQNKVMQDEFKRAIKNLPKMQPGKQNGKKVPTSFSSIITFYIE